MARTPRVPRTAVPRAGAAALAFAVLLVLWLAIASTGSGQDGPATLSFQVKLDVVRQELSPAFCWFHPRVAAVPGQGRSGSPAVIMTLQKHLVASDHYSGLYMMRTDDLGKTWSGPTEIPELAWVCDPSGATIAVADVTPGWHAPSGKVLALGAQVRYGKSGHQLSDIKRAHQTAYAVYDPKIGAWSRWKQLEVPGDEQFNFARNACSQWLVRPDGQLLIPLYIARSASVPFMTTVARYRFDGEKLAFQEHGNVLELKVARGLYEPSLAWYKGRYYLTLRNDVKGYVTTSDDGLQYRPVKPWTFDDGRELGSYNTQQHWVVHSDGLFLSYTRRGANNDHVPRNRAPIFMAQVDTDRLCVLRGTEKVLIPERGVMLGNFGAAPVTPEQSWVTDAEFIVSGKPHPRGANGSVFAARVIWSKPSHVLRSALSMTPESGQGRANPVAGGGVCVEPRTLAAAASISSSAGSEPVSTRGIEKDVFGTTSDGTQVERYTLRNAQGMVARLITYGATVTELHVPDRQGKLADVVLGFDNLRQYETKNPYFGCVVGRVAFRIAGGQFSLDGKTHQLSLNNGPHHMHGGFKSFSRVVWKAEPLAEQNAVRLRYRSPHGDEGYPGNLDTTVVYTLTNQNELRIDYTAAADQPTPVNLTHHGYFNLAGAGSGDVMGHVLELAADRYTPMTDKALPTGQIAAVAGTPFDFTRPMRIGDRLDKIGGAVPGYDLSYLRTRQDDALAQVASLYEPGSGRLMQVHTTPPAIVLYTGNYLDGTLKGKGGAVYGRHAGVCLEAGHLPDSVHHETFPSIILRPPQVYRQTCVYRFGVHPHGVR